MAWVRFDDKMPGNPKVLEAGILGRMLWENVICWSNEHLTDGHINVTVLHDAADLLAARARRELGVSIVGEEIIARCVAVGLIEPVDGDYQIHDYLEFQPAKSEKERDRKATAERVRKHRSNGGGNGVTNGSVTAPRPDPSPSEKNTKKSPKIKRPEGWQPTVSHAQKCDPYGLNVETLAEEFCNFHDSKGNRFADWNKAFHTWISNAIKGFGTGGKPLKPVAQRELIRAPRNEGAA